MNPVGRENPKPDLLEVRPAKWNRHFFVLVAFSFLILFSGLHRGDLSGYDDALYAHEAKQMVLTGHWWDVRFNGQPNFENPPVFLWLEALSMEVFGFTDFAAKLPVALLAILTIILTYLIAFELTGDPWLSSIAMLVLLSTQYFMKYATHAMTDVPFAFFILVAVLAYAKGLHRPHYFLICGLALGLAMLTRSVVGLLPAGIFLTHLIVIRKQDRAWSWQAIAGGLIACLLPVAWYASQYYLYGSAVMAGHTAFIAGKIGSASLSVAERVIGLTEYPKLLLRLYWPWLPLLIVGVVMQLKRCRTRDKFAVLTILWIGWMLIPLSLAQVKILRYLMAVFPAFALVVAVPLNRWTSEEQKQKTFRWLYGLGSIVVLYLFLFPTPRLRATDMKLLAPVAEAHSKADERILIYTGGQLQYNYNNQFLWYANRYSELLTTFDGLRARIRSAGSAVVLMDRESFESFRDAAVDSHMPIRILEESSRFVCFTATQPWLVRG